MLQTLKVLGCESVGVYTEGEEGEELVERADRAFLLKGETLAQTYGSVEQIVQVAQKTQCDAVHPGYGFLSEDPSLARACERAGLVFIGPSAEAMERAGNKFTAKRVAEAAGVPVAPYALVKSSSEAARAAREIGYPIMLKAAFGGGGRGMREVLQEGEIKEALASARREAKSAFGRGTMMVEKVIPSARHIEVQIVASKEGKVLCLGERECTLQRRHQKVVEESPAPGLSAEVRAKLFAAAEAVAKALDYENAGTVEFLVGPRGDFYFLEVNARIQVEHPVTELRTGRDIVALQLAVAAQEPLPENEEIAFQGVVIEARLNAEVPTQNFLPSSGRVHRVFFPRHPFVRIDTWLREGSQVDSRFDSLLAKVVAKGETRDMARKRLLQALGETVVLGVKTNGYYLMELLKSPFFCQGDFSTKTLNTFTPREDPQLFPLAALSALVWARKGDFMAPSRALQAKGRHSAFSRQPSEVKSSANPWKALRRFRILESS